LLPIFFAVVGLSTRFGLLDHAMLWGVAALVVAVATIAKWGGTLVAARVSGEDWRRSNALGLLMNTRGLTEIVILTIGRSLGVISPAVFTIMVLMALVTTLMATPLLAVFYPARLVEQERAAAEAATRPEQPASVPTPAR
jgi:Kef-type K+ transport system membrane component KefB